MALFQVSFPIAGDQVDALEELLYEVDESHWNIYLDHETQAGKASGVYEGEEEALEDWHRIAPFIMELFGEIEPVFEALPDEDWKDSYKIHFKPWNFEGLHWVPVWEKETYKTPEGDAVVWLDPGMAFGTGNHETTRLCIEALIVYLKERSREGGKLEEISCCDAGCGSGILAISARKMGISSVVGFDNDPDAVRISHENAALNNLTGQLDFGEGDLETGFRQKAYDLIFANILGAVLVKHPTIFLKSINPRGRLILSGILTREADEVIDIYGAELSRLGKSGTFISHALGEWSDVVIDLA